MNLDEPNSKTRQAIKTRAICVLLLAVGILANGSFLKISFDRREYVVKVATYALLAYMVAVPIVLILLRGERLWRLGVFLIWLAYVVYFGHVMLTMN